MSSPIAKAASSDKRQQLRVLLCKVCNQSDWDVDDTKSLRCQVCNAQLPRNGNIVDCQPDGTDGMDSTIDEWLEFYERPRSRYSAKADWWRLSCWHRFLFRYVLPDLKGKVVLDVGCGTADRVITLAPVQDYRYHYVGIDASSRAVAVASGNLPDGIFLCANLDSLRLQEETADIVLCLGVLMYFQEKSRILDHLLNALKPGGILLLHEQVCRRSWNHAWRKMPSSPTALAKEYGVNIKDLYDFLAKRGTILNIHLDGSPWRTLGMGLLDDSSFQSLRPAAARWDSIWCASIGRALPSVGASEIQVVYQKK